MIPSTWEVTRDLEGGGPIPSAMNAMTQAALDQRKKELENKYYVPNIESEISQREALTEGQKNINQFYKEDIQSQIAARNQKIQQDKMTQDLIKSILYGQDLTKTQGINQPQANVPSPTNNIQNNPQLNFGPAVSQKPPQENQATNLTETQNTPPFSTNNNQLVQPSTSSIQNNTTLPSKNQLAPSNMTYPKAAILNHLLGLGPPQIIDVNGQKMAVTPFGNIPVAKGMTPSEEAYQTGKGKFTAESYGKDVDTYSALQNQGVALDAMISAIDNPEFYNVTGPVSSFFKNWTGTPEQKQLLGSLQTESGEIALQIAPSLKGAWTGKDQIMINGIKANPNTDFADVFIGKLRAQKLISEVLKERARLAAEYKDSGMSAIKANEKAAKETPLSKFKPIIDKLIKPQSIWIKNSKTGERKKVSREEASKLGVKL